MRQLEPGFGTVEWGFVIGAPFWGTGVFEESANLVLDFAFETLGVHRLEARAAVLNGRGNGALVKIGAVQECVLRQAFRNDDEVWIGGAMGGGAGGSSAFRLGLIAWRVAGLLTVLRCFENGEAPTRLVEVAVPCTALGLAGSGQAERDDRIAGDGAGFAMPPGSDHDELPALPLVSHRCGHARCRKAAAPQLGCVAFGNSWRAAFACTSTRLQLPRRAYPSASRT